MRSIPTKEINSLMKDVDYIFTLMPKVDKSLVMNEPLKPAFVAPMRGVTVSPLFEERDYQKWLKLYGGEDHCLLWYQEWIVDPEQSVNWNWTGWIWYHNEKYHDKMIEWHNVLDQGYNDKEDIEKWIDTVKHMFSNTLDYSGLNKDIPMIALVSKTQDQDMETYLINAMETKSGNYVSKAIVKRSLRHFIYQINTETKKAKANE